MKNDRGEVTGAINCAYDITERKQVEEHQKFLMGELAHRGGNLLAVIQAIVARSLSGTKPLAEERNTLMRRLQALARSQSALMNKGFQGAFVAEIIRLEFEGFSDRVIATGPDVMLSSRSAQTFALLLHELATNAIKYGALSLSDKGRVDIHWSIEGEAAEARFKFHWQERDGPPVVVPTRKGFGSSCWKSLPHRILARHQRSRLRRWIELFNRRFPAANDSRESADESPAFKRLLSTVE